MATAIDNLGRKIDSSNMSLGEIKALIGTMMKSKVGAPRPIDAKKEGNGDQSEGLGKVRELLEQYTKDFAREMQEQKGFLSDVVDNLRELVQKRIEKKAESKGQPKKEKKDKKDKPFISKEEKLMSKSSDGLYKTFSKKGSGYTHDIYVEKAIRELCSCLKGISPPSTPTPAPDDGESAGGKTGGSSNGAGGRSNSGADPTRMIDGLAVSKDLTIMSNFMSEISNEMYAIEKHLLGFNVLGEIFNGVIDKERKIVQEMRSISYEIAGATKESMGLMRSFEDIGSTTKQTGVDRDVFQKSYVKALKHGIKDLKVASNLVKTQLNTEKQLGMEAGSLGEEFVSWNKAGRMSIGQLADMGRGMREIARNTGMTGDELAGVIKGSKEFIDTLRNAATLTATAAKNVIEIGANAKKLGIESQMQPLMKAMTSSSNLFLEATDANRALLLMAASSVGRMSELTTGTITKTKAGIQAMGKGFENVLKRFGVESFEAIDQLSEPIKAQINVAMKSTIGMELGELRAAKETLDEAGKGMADRLSDINKKRQQNLTLEERASLMEEERRMKTSKNLEVLTALDEAAKGAKDMNQALATFGKRRGDFESDLNALGQSWTSEADVARGAIQNAMNSVNDGLKEAGKQELTIDSSAIERALKDPAAMRELTSQISKGEQELATAQKSQLDPLTDMQHSLSEINDNIRNYTNKSFSMFFNSLIGKILVIGAAITAAITGIGLLAMGIIVKLDSFKRVLSTIDKRQGLFKVLKGTFGQEKVEDKHGNRPGEEGYVETFEKSLYGLIKGTLGFGHPKKDGPEAGLPKGDEPLVRAKTKDPIAEALNSIKIDDEDIFPKMYDELKAIRKCVCMDKSKLISDKSAVEAKAASSPDKSKWAADKAAGQAKAASMSPTEKTQARIDRKLQDKDALMQKKDVKMQKNDIKSQKVGDKVQDAQQSLVVRQTKMASAESGSIPTTPKTEGFDLAGMLASGKEMAKAAVAVAILGLGIIALGAAIVFLSSKIMSAFKLDIKTVLETAAVVGAVALAGGAIAAAGFVALEALSSDKMKSFTEKAKTSYPKVLTAAAALMLIGPAIVLLGAAVVAMTGLILSKLGLNIGSVAETAAVIVAVAGVTGAMAAGAKEFVECLEGLQEGSTWKKIIDNPGAIAKEIGKAAAALLLVGGVIMLLGVALVKMGQVVMSVAGLDPSTAVKVATQVAGLIVAAGAIAGAIIGASFGLKALGEFAKKSTGLVKDMAVGAVALLIMTPAIVLLASAVIWASTSIMGAFGMDSGVAAKAAMNIGELILATGFIALAIMGASAGLALLGAFALSFSGPQALALAGLMAAGAGALLLLTPAITALAAGVVYMAQKVMGSFGLDLGTAAKVAKDLAGVLMAAGFIALAVMGTGWALGQLGALVASGLIWPTVLMAGLGAIGLMALTPAITALAASVVYMAKSVMKNIIDPAEAGKVAEALGDVIGAAAAISISVLGMGAALAALGLAMTTGVFLVMAPLALLGAAGLLVLTPAVVALNAAIISMSQSITGVSPAHGKEIAEALSSILSSAGNIANEVLGAVGSLSKLGALSLFAGIISKLMWMGVGALDTLAGPVKGYIGAVVDIAQSMKSSLNPKQAVEMAKGVAEILASCGAVTEEIMKAKDKLLSMPAATKWFQFMRTTLQKDLFAGQSFLRYISLPIQAYVNAIVEFSRAIGGSLNPKQAAEMGKGVAEILAACGAVTEEMMKAKDKLLSMPAATKWFQFMRTTLQKDLFAGQSFLRYISLPIQAYVNAIVEFSRAIGGSLNPKQAAEMGKGVAEILAACGAVTEEMMKAKDKLLSMPAATKWFQFMRTTLQKDLFAGQSFLRYISLPIQAYVNAIVEFSRAIGESLNPKQAAEMGKGVAEILAACGAVTEEMMKAKDKLLSMPAATKWFQFMRTTLQKDLFAGQSFLRYISLPIQAYVNAIVEFSRAIGGSLNPKQAAEMGKGVAEILAACGAVTEEMMKAKDKLLSMKGSVGFWKSVPIEDAMSVGVEALKKMKQPIMDYVGTIVGFAQDIGGKVNVGSAKSMVKSLTAVSTIVELVSNVLNTLSEKIVPLTQGGWFTGSPIKQMTKAKGQMEVFFPAMVDLIRTIIDKVSGSLGDTKELKSAAKGLQAMAMILNAALPSITIMGEKIAPLTQGGFFTDSPIDKIKSAIPQFDGFFNAVGEFVNKIVVAMATIKDTTGLSDAAKKMTMLATVLESTSKAIGSLASMVGLMDDGLFTKSPITKIIENKTKFADYFTQIAEFVNIGIVEPINNKFPDGKSLQTASVIVLDLARLLCGTKVTLESLASVIGLMEPKTFFDKAPLQKIIDNKDQFKSWFIAIAEFVKEGIVIPVNDKFKDPKQILTAANTISNMAVVAKNIVPMIKNLAEAISLGTDSSSFFDVAPIPKIIENKGQFKIWFQSIAEFMRDGIVNPVNKEMKGIDIGSASQTITAMAKIAGSIVPMITNLSGAMGLVSDPAEKFWDRDFPIDKIMVYKNDFAKWFKSIAIFMRDGIIIPILTVLPEPQTIQMAAQILSAMSQVITLVPAVINKMANGLIPLIDSGVSIDETAKQKLEGKTDTFRNWFTSVAQFMVDGIILPILTVLPEPQTIQMAAQILSAMSRVITMLPTIISNLSAMFIPLDAGKCLKDSPISALAANADIFAAWFNSITLFVRDGILRPIMTNLPTADEITAGMSQLGNMSKGIAAAEQMVTYVSERMNQLSINPFWTMVASWKASIFSNAFTELANTINNGIFQPMKLLPTSDEMIEAISQMKFMAKTFDIANKVFTYVSGRMSEFSINPFWTIMASWKASMFGYAFMGVANAINNGILQPMKLLPPSSEIDEVVNQLDGMVMALNKVEEVLGAMDIAMKSISNSGIDFSALDKIPVQKMAMFATALKDMTAATSMGSGGSAGTGGGAGTPSEKAIETQLLRDQSITQQSMSTALTQMVNEAMTGDGLFVRDRLNFKAQNDMIKIQRDEAKSALMPSAAQTASASKSGGFELTEESKKKIKEAQAKPAAAGNLFHRLDMRKIQRDKAKSALMPSAAQTASASASKSGGFELTEESKKKIKEAQAKNDPLKPAIKSINPSSAIGNLDMRSAAESMKDTPMQRALGDNIRERANKNPYTDRLKESQEATRIRREQAGFQTGGEAMSPPRAEFGNFFKNEEKIRGSSEPGRLISSNPGGNESGNATMQPVARATGISDMHSAVAQDKASSSPSKTEITSPELGTIASEAGDHNAKLDTLITLFQQVLTALKPSSTPITSSGGSPGDTKTRDVVHKPANFFRNTVGLVTQTAGKAALNMGAPNA